MKKYVLFFISIGVILSTILIFNVVHIEKSKQETFSESGYILNGSTNRYYFYQDETYTTSYNDQIVFYDTEGSKVTIDNNNFIHYTSGNIVALQQSVLLDLSKINDNPIVYYDVSANKEIKKISNRYTVKNLDNDLQFEQAIWKVSANKYIVLGNKIEITLNNGMTKEVEGYVEIEYSDNEIVNIYNQEFSYQTISSNSYIELQNNIRLNLGTKIVSQNEQNKMSLEDMVINSNDNVTLVDLTPAANETDNNDQKEENEVEENKTNEVQAGTMNGGTTSSSSTTTSSSSTTLISNTTTEGGTTDENENKINIETPDILYEYVSDNESKVDETQAINEPKFKLENMQTTAVGITGNIQITDENDALSKNDDIDIKILNNSTGKTVYAEKESYGVFNIPLNVETLLPNTSYTVIASATYVVSEKSYTKNFIYKTFVTSDLGVKIDKESYTDNMLTFSLSFSDKLVDSVEVSLLDANGEEIINRKQTIKNGGSIEEVVFDGLIANTDYIVRVSRISYDGITQESDNWIIDTKCKTLKSNVSINSLNYSINKRNGTFTLYVDNITDNDNAIQNYKYIVYKYTQIKDKNGNYILDYDTQNIAYQRETTNKEITINVGDENSDEEIIRGQYYGFKVIATTYDNEKYVDVESTICGAFALNGLTFPSVKFERVDSDYPPTEIRGWFYIIDNENTITVDNENPLTITYYSDVDEGNVYVKRTSLQNDERITDTDGNEVIRIWVDIGEKGSSKKGLKAETSYTFAAYGTINLKDGNGDYQNTHIGSSIVTTGAYEPLTAKFALENREENAFTVDLKLQGDNVAQEGLTSVNLMLYEGSGDINNGEYNNWTRTITENNFTSSLGNIKDKKQVNSLKELFFDNTLVVTPSFIGGGKESSYTEVNYQVIVTATIDGTEYTNKIPIKVANDGNEDTGNTTYTDEKTNETYSAAYIIVKGKGTTSDVPEEFKKITASAITNEDASKYGIEKDSTLENSTYVGYYVSTPFTNTGSLTAQKITYYAWDDEGNPVLDENGNQIIKTLDIVNQEKMPSAVFEIGYGTTDDVKEDNNSGLHRGNAYFFSYTILYKDTEGKDIIWPTCQSDENTKYDNKSLKTDTLYPNKQEPKFVMYPKTSDESTITYSYSCTDPDKALYYSAHSTTEYAYLNLSVNGTIQNSSIEVKTDGVMGETTVGPLAANNTYKIIYTKNLNKVRTSVYTSQDLVTQKFEGVVHCNDISISNILCNDSNNQNKVIIQLAGQDINRVAAAKVVFSNGEEEIETKFLSLNKQNGTYITIDLIDMLNNQNFKTFLGKDISLKVKVYYDNGKIGFAPIDGTKYASYTNVSNSYMGLEANNFVVGNGDINGKIYEYRFYNSDESVQLGLKNINNINNNANGSVVTLQYSPNGLLQNDNIIVQKEISEKIVDEFVEHKINIQNIRLGINVSKIKTTISTATINAKIYNPLNIDIEHLTMEIWHSKDKDAIPDWNDCITKTIGINQVENIELQDLSPAEHYHIRFKYLEEGKNVYFYDTITKEIGVDYQFETLATIGIEQVKIKYNAETYKKKFIDISYNIDSERSNMYEKTKYTFYDADTKEQVQLKNETIKINNESANYEIIDGALVVTNPSYKQENKFSEVFEQISISPENNVFTIGKKYILKITPIVTINDTEECEIENVTSTFKLDPLKDPLIGLKVERKQLTSNIKYARIMVSINDESRMMYGSDWGEYTLKVYKYKEGLGRGIEINVYDKYQGGTNVRGNTFNLKEHGTNYALYIQEKDIDYSYSYKAVLTAKYDRSNTGENLEEHTEEYILQEIANNAGVAIGSATLVQNGNTCEIRLYDSYYNIDKIDSVEYSIFDLSSNYNKTGKFIPEWANQSEGQNIIYYKAKLPAEFEAGITYTIKMNLYAGDILVGQIDTTYKPE